MATREDLQLKLEELNGNGNVYYNPPANIQMKYDAIRYTLSAIQSDYADNNKYKNMKCYDLIVISKRHDPEVVDKILELPYSSLGRPYRADNLNHYPITLYY